MTGRDFDAVFLRLKTILQPLAGRFVVSADGPGGYTLTAPPSKAYPDGLFFAGVRKGRSYVSFYLMNIYTFPELLEAASPAIKKRMQGKSCFTFSTVDEIPVAELLRLSKAGLENFLKFAANRPESSARKASREKLGSHASNRAGKKVSARKVPS